MKERMIEGIRQLLIKTVLPFRKKKEEFLSKLRLSLTFRIAVNYAKLFIINGIILALLFGLLFIVYWDYEYSSKVDEVTQIIKDNIEVLTNADKSDDGIINPYYHEGIEIRITDEDDDKVIYDDSKYDMGKKVNFLNKVYINRSGNDREMYIYRKSVIETKKGNYKLEFANDFSGQYSVYVKIVPFMIVVIFLLAIVMSISGSTQLQFIMNPIKKMSEAANKLTVNNLNSERLNVEGTKNELKDLAATINEMLDRIEVSYESQKQFVSDASHELRTPISVIQGYVNMVDRWGKDDPSIMEESITAIKEESQSMQSLVEKLLFLSRNDKKTLKLDKKIFNMKDVVEELLKETKMVAQDRKVWTRGLDDVSVYGDKQTLKQAIRVFIDNAIKYSQSGDEIIISCENYKGACKVSVEDTGIGMKEKDMDNIFERFYRSDDVRNKSIAGHGLGLSIAKLIVLKHTGSIRIRSQYEKGTCFTIVLPRIYR